MHKSNTVLAVTAVIILMLVVGCNPPASKPTVTIGTAPDSLAMGDSMKLVASVDPNTATLAWSAVKNTVTAGPDTEAWYKGTIAAYDTVTLIATKDDLKDTAVKAIKVYAKYYGMAEYDNTETYEIPFPAGDTAAPIYITNDGTGDDSVPAGAIVDSVEIYNLDINYDSGHPDSFPDMNIWLQEPGGERVQIRDISVPGDPSGTYFPSQFTGFAGKQATGTWKLVAHAENSIVAGTIDDFWLYVWYHKTMP